MSNSARDILDTILERLRNLANTETVVGEPIKLDEITLLPVIKISVGFGAGGMEGSGDNGVKGQGHGGGGGGGAAVTPVGFIVWDGHEVRFIAIGKGKIETLVETIPDLLRKFGFAGRGRRDHSSAEATESPAGE